MSEAFDFLGFRIPWRRKRGTNKRYAHTFTADRPIQPAKDKIRALTADTRENPPPRDQHRRFSERLGETDREQSRHRAPTDSTTVRLGDLNNRDQPRPLGTPLTRGFTSHSEPSRGL
jgi:hypothetical protein